MKRFWNFTQSQTRDKAGELILYGEISDVTWYGDEVTPKTFKEELDALGDIDTLDIYVNSGGGDVFAGFAIFNILFRCKAYITAYIDGIAASIASFIIMAADKIVMAKNSLLMIHNCWTSVGGNKEKMRKVADEMERIDGIIADTYAEKMNQKRDVIAALMTGEKWFDSEEAIEAGIVDEVDEAKQIAASIYGESLNVGGQVINLNRYFNAEKLRAQIPAAELEAEKPETKKPENGEEIQPVSDKTALLEQRKQFWNIRKKILGGKVA